MAAARGWWLWSMNWPSVYGGGNTLEYIENKQGSRGVRSQGFTLLKGSQGHLPACGFGVFICGVGFPNKRAGLCRGRSRPSWPGRSGLKDPCGKQPLPVAAQPIFPARSRFPKASKVACLKNAGPPAGFWHGVFTGRPDGEEGARLCRLWDEGLARLQLFLALG